MSTFVETVTKILNDAGIPPVRTIEAPGDDAGWRVESPGYSIHGGRKYASVAILGRDGVPDSARQAERDGILQATHHALLKAGCRVTVNEHGALHVTGPEGSEA